MTVFQSFVKLRMTVRLLGVFETEKVAVFWGVVIGPLTSSGTERHYGQRQDMGGSVASTSSSNIYFTVHSCAALLGDTSSPNLAQMRSASGLRTSLISLVSTVVPVGVYTSQVQTQSYFFVQEEETRPNNIMKRKMFFMFYLIRQSHGELAEPLIITN